jgi:hypothetical protein
MISLVNIAEVDDILLIIGGFVSINALLMSSKKLLLLKMSYFRWNLTRAASQRFNQSQPFRDMLVSLMTYPRKQLHIKLNGCDSVTDVSMLGNVHTLNLSHCSNVRDVSMLGNVHTLDLSHCYNVTDVSMLGNVHRLNLSHFSNVSDVGMLGNVHTLDLSHCDNVSDVGMLGNVHTLDLSHCPNVTDVSTALLGNINLFVLFDDIREFGLFETQEEENSRGVRGNEG